ncbi:MAG: SusC/RagA family TonB-linked outer membrane protein [Pedobacter sp.]|uniref:SusC/RagA family TonB-linked outer membrane protein n=1 Tax=Pedobacter sp. TaxID=1411316 RepID=UPI0028088ABB|nr:SusC/RagA family TonB-linked outer membrane protein [Pedobacter sp.]MDQ8005261.1 SusC/RagA family TonB-linked outer membrane protein [Pedobacter sp.]
MNKILISLSFLLLGLISVNAQKVKISLIDTQTKQPVSDASLALQQGKIKQTYQIANGEVLLTKHAGINHLKITALGYKPTDTIINFDKVAAIVIQLQPIQTLLQEVSIVSNGYQQIEKERSVGSYQQISNSQFNSQVGTQVLSRLEAIGNSLKVDRAIGENQLNIRGISSIGGPRSILVILDNFPYEGDLSNINPNDVDQITILKDAAATSIWGARAGNGVVVITTKTGRYQQALSISLNINQTIGQAPNLEYLPQMSTKDFVELEEYLFKADRYKADYNAVNKPALSPVVALLYDNSISQAEKQQMLNELKTIDARQGYSQHFYQTALNQQYAINIKGGSEKFKWLSAVGYDNNTSNLAAQYTRLSIRYTNEYKILDRLSLQSAITYTNSSNKSGKPEFKDISSSKGMLYPYTQFADANGSPLPIVKDYNFNYINSAGNGKLLDWKYYPLTDDQYHTTTSPSKDILLNTGLNYRYKGLVANVKYQYQQQETSVEELLGLESYAARNLINSYSQINSDGTVTYAIPKGAILNESLVVMKSHNVRTQLDYKVQKSNHDVDVMAGAELRAVDTKGLQFRYYGYNEELASQTNVNYTSLYPNFITGATSFIPSNNGIAVTANRFVSLYANAAYSYSKRYTAYLSARKDASNIFGVNTNDKWKPLWSAAVAWNVSDETFFNLKQVPYLKIRLSYGTSGNIDPSKTAVTTIRYASVSPYTQSPYALIDKFYNPELKWETVQMTNIGVDFALFNRRISGSIEYFKKKAKDLFASYPIDYTTGVGSFIVKNVGAMKGQGLDLNLKLDNIQGKFTWSTNLNTSFYRDKVTDYYLQADRSSSLVTTNPTFSGILGKPVYALYAFRWMGLDPKTGDPLGAIDGVATKDYARLLGADTKINDLVYIGSAIPTFFGNINNQFSYGRATLSFQLLYKFGHFFRTPSINYNELIASGKGHIDYQDRWQKPGDENQTHVPSFVYPNASNRDTFYLGTEVLVQSADHIRLQYVSFNYQLLKSTNKYFKQLDVYANIANLGVLWKANKAKVDPEYNGLNKLLPSKTFSIGTNINF